MVGDSSRGRDLIIDCQLIDIIVEKIKNNFFSDLSEQDQLVSYWTLGNLARGNPAPNFWDI